MATAQQWLSAARPRTLAAAAAPVLVGTAAAIGAVSVASTQSRLALGAQRLTHADFHLGRALLALGIALALQIGVNYANDYSDGIRGTDLDRKGPTRLTASRAAKPKSVRNAAFTAFGVAALLGLWLITITGHWWLIAAGLAAIIAALFYTGGKRPYGYAGFGEVGVFAFFGLVATLGTTFTQLGRLNVMSALGAIGVGLLACAILMINNIRDIPTDILAGKKTLAVRLGDHRARLCYLMFLAGALLVGLIAAIWVAPLAWFVLLLAIPAWLLTIPVRIGAQGPLLIPVLAGTSALELAYAIILAIAFILA